MRRIWQTLASRYDRHPRWSAILTGSALLAILVVVHALAGFTTAFQALYVLPIWLATRTGGRVSGMALVVLCALTATFTEWQVLHPAEGSMALDLLIRLIALSGIMLLIAQVEFALQKHQRMAM